MASTSADDGFSRTKKVGVWSQDSQIHPKETLIPQKSVESENEIPTLPDADDVSESGSKDANISPKMHQSSMYQELDSELLKQNSYAALDGVNLSPLLKFIHPDVNLKENDVQWTIDSLFDDLSKYYSSENRDD